MASESLICSGCRAPVAYPDEPTHNRLSAMQEHDRECAWHDAHGQPCRHGGSCYQAINQEN